MILFRAHHISIMVLFVVSLHLWWAFLIFIDPVSTVGTTSVASLAKFIGPPFLLVVVLAGTAASAIIALWYEQPWSIVLFLLPQQILLMMSAAGAVEAVWLGQYADGVERPLAFIAADQAYAVFAALGHTTALIAHLYRDDDRTKMYG